MLGYQKSSPAHSLDEKTAAENRVFKNCWCSLVGENHHEYQHLSQRETSNFEVVNQPCLTQLSRTQYHQRLSTSAVYG
jgi:hypothetical protein